MKTKFKCSKHKYTGKGEPKAKNCGECLVIWAKMIWAKHRREHKPTKVVPSKKLYTRKRKHKKNEV